MGTHRECVGTPYLFPDWPFPHCRAVSMCEFHARKFLGDPVIDRYLRLGLVKWRNHLTKEVEKSRTGQGDLFDEIEREREQ